MGLGDSFNKTQNRGKQAWKCQQLAGAERCPAAETPPPAVVRNCSLGPGSHLGAQELFFVDVSWIIELFFRLFF